MSLPELTRNSFQCGISASKWLGLCKLLIAKTPTINSSDLIPSNLSNSVLFLYRSYPGDPDLQDYLKAAIQDGILPVSTFVATLLQAARSPSLHIPATLNTLCRIALDAHYSSGQPPIGSLVSFSESSIVTLSTVHDALALLRTAHTLSISHFHQLTTSASELVILLLSCVSDLSQLSTAQAMVYFNEVTFLLTHYRLSPEVRQVLDSFVISLTLLIGDDAKAAREAQMMQNLQFALGRGDISGPNSDGDMTTLGLMLNTMITYRAHEFGAGDITNAVALLVAGFRWSSWTPPVYYTQILLSAFNCLSQSASTTGAKIWKAFIVGRLPILLASFTDTVLADKSMTVDLRGAFQTGLAAAFRRPDLILQGDHTLSRETTSSNENFRSRSFSRELLQQLSKLNMVPQQVALQLDPLVFSESLPKWYGEANDMGLDLAAYLESKIMHDNNMSEAQVWIDRIWKDVGSHSIFANIILKRFSSPVTSLDVESLGHICKILYTYEHAMEIVALHVRITDLLFFSLQFLEEYDCETVGDPQTAFSHLGDVVLFVQYTLAKYKFENKDLVKNNRRVSPDFLINTDGVLSAQDRPQEDIVSFSAWFKALFDSNSEGIEDTILRSTKPKVLLRIAPNLFSSAIQATLIHKIDKDVLLNGVSYFTSPLLNWTLVGVIKSLAKDIQRVGFSAMTHLEILQSLVLSSSCPKPVLALCSPNIVSLLYEKKRQQPIPVSFNIAAVRQVLADAIGMKGGGESLVMMDLSAAGQQISYQQVQRAVQTAFMMARSHKPPYLDVRRCIKIVPPIKFLQLFWAELVAAANLGELEACRRIATFVLTMPQDSTVCPLLPVFMHIVLPSLVASASKQPPPEQAVTVELLVVTISSVLNAALHLEWSIRSVSGDDRLVLGQLSTTTARRLAQDLRRNRGRDVNTTILRRLASSQSFVANFPTFISELNP